MLDNTDSGFDDVVVDDTNDDATFNDTPFDLLKLIIRCLFWMAQGIYLTNIQTALYKIDLNKPVDFYMCE